MKCKLAADCPSDILPCFAGNINKGFFFLNSERRGHLKKSSKEDYNEE
jgi:hypothetical protein